MSQYWNEPVERRKIRTAYRNGVIEYLFVENYSYDQENPLLPCGFFWSYLSKAGKGPKVWIPDTFILGQGENQSIWIYTNNKGTIEKSSNRSTKDFITKLHESEEEGNVVAVLKKVLYRNDTIVGHDIRLMRNHGVSSCVAQLPGNLSGAFTIQRFVKCKGPKSFICRTVWRARGTNQCFLVTSHRNYNDDQSVPELEKYSVSASNHKSNIVRITHGKQMKQTLEYIKNIVKFFQKTHNMVFLQIMADFVKDDNDVWWLVNVKGFQLQKISQIPKQMSRAVSSILQTHEVDQKQDEKKYQKTKICKYCQKPFLQSLLKYKMTLKMIILTDRYLLHRGKTFKWLQRSDINNIQLHSIYQQHRVCERCYKLYIYTKQLMDIQVKYAQKMGIILTNEQKYNMVMNVGSKYLEQQSKNRQVSKMQNSPVDQNLFNNLSLQLGPYSKLIIENNCPMKNNQIINQMIRYRFIINLVEIDQLTKTDPSLTYYLEYSLINIKVKYKLDIHPGDKTIPLNKLRVIYAFCHDRKTLNEFITEQNCLTIHIVTQNQRKQKTIWGKTELPLEELISDKIIKREYYKMFNLKDVSWGWGLTANIGISSSHRCVDTSRNIFRKHKGLVYYPQNQQYFACQPLHADWISMLRQQNINQNKNNRMKETIKKQSRVRMRIEGKEQNDENLSETTPGINLQKEIDNYIKRGKTVKKKRYF